MLAQKLNYAWRVCATGLAFVSFGIGGVATALVISPTVRLLAHTPKEREILTQKIIKQSFKKFIDGLVFLRVMTYDVKGLDKLENSYGELVIANHPTLLDVVMLIAFMPRANCVVKQKLLKNPFTRSPVKCAGYVLNHGASDFVDACVAKLSASTDEIPAGSLIIFPEGTRTEKGQQLNKFQRGAANIAVRAGVPIRPVLIDCRPSTLTKNEKWYHIPKQAFHLQLTVLDAVHWSDRFPELQPTPKDVRKLNTWLYQFFQQELSK